MIPITKTVQLDAKPCYFVKGTMVDPVIRRQYVDAYIFSLYRGQVHAIAGWVACKFAPCQTSITCQTLHLTLFAAIVRGFLGAFVCSQANLLSSEGVERLYEANAAKRSSMHLSGGHKHVYI
eukprot:2773661-Amphidinium_carterae.1